MKLAVLLAGLVSLGSITSAAAQEACTGVQATYEVRRVSADEFSVDARFSNPVSRLDLYFFPVEGRPQGQADSIRDLRAFGQSGRRVDFNYVGEAAWEASAGASVSRVTYRVRADHDQVDWGQGGPGKDEVATRFDRTYFFVGHAFFLTDFSMPRCPIEVRFDLPRNWRVTTPWPMVGNVATAAGPTNLAQNAFALGEDIAQTSTRGGFEVEWLIDSAVAPAGPRIGALMEALPPVYTEFWGRAPLGQLTTFYFADAMSDGGAFENSFAMRLATPLSPADEITWSHTLGHEMMHLWLGAGAIQGPSNEEIAWFTEGFADYLTIKLMRRTGLIDQERLAQRIAGVLRRYELARRFSPEVSLSEAGADKLQNWELIYGGGALAALLLDAELSARDPHAFRDMMRAVYGEATQQYDQARLLRVMDASSAGAASEVYGFVNGRSSFAEIRARLARAGIDVAHFASDEAYVVFGACGEADCAPPFLAGPPPR